MAKKESPKKLERSYIIPLRKATMKTARWRRAKKSISTIRSFMKRHMKCENIKIGQELNELIWERGGKKVPSKVNVFAKKEEDIVHVNLAGLAEKAKKVEEKPKAAPKEEKEVEIKAEEPKAEEKVEEAPVEEPKEEKSE